MAEYLCNGVLHRESEFALVAPGVRVFGACGVNSLAEAASNTLGVVKHTTDVYWVMRNAGACDAQGVTTIGGVHSGAETLGLPIVDLHWYDQAWTDWPNYFDAYAGQDPFVAQVGNGQALVDAISGDGENANHLQSHFVCVLGRNTGGWSPFANRDLPAGYWVADGDNFAGGNDNANNFNAANVLQYYPDPVMRAAWPTAALTLRGNPKASPKMAWTQQSDGSGKDDQGHTCGAGTYQAIVAANMASADGRQSETHYSAAGVADVAFTPLVNGAVFHAVLKAAGGAWVVDQNAAQVTIDLFEALQAANAEIVKLKQAPAPVPPTDPEAAKALAAIAALKAALA